MLLVQLEQTAFTEEPQQVVPAFEGLVLFPTECSQHRFHRQSGSVHGKSVTVPGTIDQTRLLNAFQCRVKIMLRADLHEALVHPRRKSFSLDTAYSTRLGRGTSTWCVHSTHPNSAPPARASR